MRTRIASLEGHSGDSDYDPTEFAVLARQSTNEQGWMRVVPGQ